MLCKKCKNPETDVVIKDGRILLDCKACGQRSDVDLRLKLSSFILKNQPKKGKKDKSDKKARRAKTKDNGDAEQNANGHAGSPASNSDNPDEEDVEVGAEAASDDELTRRINAEAKDLDISAPIKDEEWAVDVSEEAVKARAKELPGELKQKLAFEEDEDVEGEGGGNSAYDQLGSWIITSASQQEEGVGALDNVEIYVKAKELGIENKHKTLTVLAQTIFDQHIASQIPKRAGMLKKVGFQILPLFYRSNIPQMLTTDRHQKALLGGTERFIGNEHPNLIPQVPKVLLAYYQEDLVSEEVLKAWGTKASKKYVDIATSKKVRKAAEPFLEWLENAESDEDDEDGDDE